ncbi:TetR family transcriptional regulator [Sulfidibacter corallicola]|uniref:TetR family transcriptional regulator n=1 Tax=Sulfidibacter corallicola TaxID=2818388 RepID=A0A8A4U276_SULCO|nr:TetR family transcriptional regulator [Sulfidibacter corallicola]QTD52835.1 TetR family transcriptional regulator [Sulfidibacter corallicola]
MASMKHKKAEQTRARILSAALPLMLEGGYEKMTMRAIAKQAGLSPGAAYYYFETKEHIIHAFYAQTHEEHRLACREVLDQAKTLQDRLKGVVQAQIRISQPYHAVSKALFKVAADPNHTLSPFSDDSRELRHRAMALFDEVVRGSKTKVSAPLADYLPGLLWMFHMGIVLFWVHDSSPQQEKTWRFIDRTVPLLIQLIRLSKLPFFGSALQAAIALLDDFQFLRLPAADAREPEVENDTTAPPLRGS